MDQSGLREQAAQLRRAADRFSLMRLRLSGSIAQITESGDPRTRAVGEEIREHWSAEEYAELGRVAAGLRESARRLDELALAHERSTGKRMGGYAGAGFLGKGRAASRRVDEVAQFVGSRSGASIGGYPLAPNAVSGSEAGAAFMPHTSHSLGAPTPDYDDD